MGLISNLLSEQKAVGGMFRQVTTVLPPGDYDFAAGQQFTHVITLSTEEDQPRYIKMTAPYLQNAWVYAAVRVMASNLTQAQWKHYIGDKEVKDNSIMYGWIKKLFDFESVIVWLSLRGECFWELIRGDDGRPYRIIIPIPETMEEIVKGGDIIGWRKHTATGILPIEAESIIQFKYFNPYNPYRGLSPLTATALGLHIDYAAAAFNYYFFNNQAIPPIILSSDQDLDDEEADGIEERWNKKRRGIQKAGAAAVLSRGAKAQPLSIAQKDIEYIPQRKWSREEVFSALEVPPALAQILEYTSIKSNIKEQRKELFENNLIPKMKFIEKVMKIQFYNREKLKGVEGRFDLSNITALSDSFKEKLEMADKLNKLGFTANEINERLELGFEETPWRGLWWIPFNLVPAGTEGEQEGKPEKGFTKALATEGVKGRISYDRYSRIWQSIYREIYPYEKKLKEDMQEYFYQMRSDILNKVFSKKAVKAITEEVIHEFVPDGHYDQIIINVVRGPYEKIYEIGVNGINNTMGTNFSMASQAAIRSINNKIIKIREINETIRGQIINDLRPIIKEGVEQGLSYDAVAQRIAEEVKNIFNNARRRTPTVARTEINGTLSQARWDTMKGVGVEKHQWYSTRYIRESHIGNHLEIREMGDLFSSGIKYPHDEDGPPEEVINCNCVTIPIVE